jgi:hypothetical protein
VDHELLIGLINANDRRYEQRFTAQQEATAAAFAALSKAMDASDRRYEQRFIAQQEALAAAFAAAQQAINKAEVSVERRLEGTNEWRAAMNDRERNFMPRLESEQRAAALEDRLAVLSERVTASTGRTRGIGDSWRYLFGALGVVAAVISAIVILLNR